jgi:HK97 gp10 family phage protein
MAAKVEFTSMAESAKNGLLEQQKKALRKCATLLRKETKAAVPVGEGTLLDNIGTWVRVKRKTGEVWLEIGVYDAKRSKRKKLTPAGFRAHFTEFGTRRSRGKSFLKAPTIANIENMRRIQAEFLPALINLDSFEDLDDEVEE